MVNLVVLLCFFPFFRYLPLGEVESQPAASLVSILSLLIYGAADSPPIRAIFALSVTIIGLMFFAVLGLSVPPAAAAQQAIAYFAPLPIIAFLWARLSLLSWRITLASGMAYLALGVLQARGLVPGFLDALLSQIISRYQSTFVGGGRGVVMFAPEPDYASRQIILFAALSLYFVASERIPRIAGVAVVIIAALAMVGLNRSITGIGVFAALLIFSSLGRFRMRRLLLLGSLLAVTTFAGWTALTRLDLSEATENTPRIVQLASSLTQAAARGNFGLADVVQFASARLVTNLAAIRATPEMIWLGGGIGRSETIVIASIQNDPLLQGINFRSEDFGNLKPQSWITAFTLEAGAFGILVLLASLLTICWEVFSRLLSMNQRGLAFGCLVTGILQLTLLGPHSLPAPWLLLVIANAVSMLNTNIGEKDVS